MSIAIGLALLALGAGGAPVSDQGLVPTVCGVYRQAPLPPVDLINYAEWCHT